MDPAPSGGNPIEGALDENVALEVKVPILLWLLGVPISIIILLMLVGAL